MSDGLIFTHGHCISLDQLKHREKQDDSEPMELCEEMAPSTPAAPPPWAMLRVDAATSESTVTAFLSRFRPSKCRDSEVSWISVLCASKSRTEEGDVAELIAEWQWSCQNGRATADALHQLARKHRVLSGKWLVFCPRNQVDTVWKKILIAVAAGRLGPCAKVSPVSSQQNHRGHVICVYANDYFDTEEVHRLRVQLGRLGHTAKLSFKPDVYTHCGIYSGNPWGISQVAFEG